MRATKRENQKHRKGLYGHVLHNPNVAVFVTRRG